MKVSEMEHESISFVFRYRHEVDEILPDSYILHLALHQFVQ